MPKSLFILADGIDTRDIILHCWLPEIRFRFNHAGIENKTLYRAVYSFFDPWVRSYLLRRLLIQHDDFGRLPTHPQRENEGITYHFMHEKTQRAAFKRLFYAPTKE